MFDVRKLGRKIARSLMDHALELTGAIIAVSIGLGAIAAPIFFNTSTVFWDTTSKTIWPYLFVLALAVFLIGMLYSFKKGRAN